MSIANRNPALARQRRAMCSKRICRLCDVALKIVQSLVKIG